MFCKYNFDGYDYNDELIKLLTNKFEQPEIVDGFMDFIKYDGELDEESDEESDDESDDESDEKSDEELDNGEYDGDKLNGDKMNNDKLNNDKLDDNKTDLIDADTLTKIINKKVLIIDLKTTGIPENNQNNFDPIDLKKYDSSRIIGITYMYTDNFDYELIRDVKIKKYIRKPTDFNKIVEFPKNSKITLEIANKYQKTMTTILNDGLFDILEECDYIIGNNVLIDINILLSELWRISTTIDKEYKITYDSLQNILNNNNYISIDTFSDRIYDNNIKNAGEKYIVIFRLFDTFDRLKFTNHGYSYNEYDRQYTCLGDSLLCDGCGYYNKLRCLYCKNYYCIYCIGSCDLCSEYD
jgi:hypothetical protein